MSRAGYHTMRRYRAADDYQERTFIRWMSNKNLCRLTEGRFTGGKPDSFHPVFLLREIAPECYQLCPCTSKINPNASYIRSGSRTSPMGERVYRDSYILHFYRFNLTFSDSRLRESEIVGQVDEGDIIGDFHVLGRKA